MSFRELEGQLARWLERLQQYDFDIYRKGLSHKNADGLSKRLCETENCQYCVRVERKIVSKQKEIIARYSRKRKSGTLASRSEERLKYLDYDSRKGNQYTSIPF